MAGKGGKRAGAGRPVGSKGKEKAPNNPKYDLDNGLTPLEYMLKVVRNHSNTQPVRMDAAKAAAPYCHARLQATELTGQVVHEVIDFNK